MEITLLIKAVTEYTLENSEKFFSRRDWNRHVQCLSRLISCGYYN
jgi:hypothetical protein